MVKGKKDLPVLERTIFIRRWLNSKKAGIRCLMSRILKPFTGLDFFLSKRIDV